jgi:putative zinc finger/helix-turn-helix YgiT family protein
MDTCWSCEKPLKVIKGKPYHYTESGLKNIILHGINQYECTACGEKAAEIPRVEDLHFVISKILVCKKTLLSGCEIRFLRKEMGLKSNVMAKILSVDPSTLSRWENAKGPVDESSDKLLRVIYMCWASEQRKEVLFQDLLKLEPVIHHGHPSKRIPQPAKIELTAAEWTVPTPGPAFVPANC